MSNARLSNNTVNKLSGAVHKIPFDAEKVGIGIVHFGVGAFHRAHQALYTQEAIALRPDPWAISGIVPRLPDVRPALIPQDCLYTVVERRKGTFTSRLVGSIREVLFAPEQPDAVNARIAAPSTRIVTLTITEKGYCLDPATSRLNEKNPEIVHDLETSEPAVTAIGQLARGLAARKLAGGGALTILSCDNIMENGKVMERALMRFLDVSDRELAAWVRDHVTFPSSMVDRIVPAATEASLAEVEAQIGLRDEAGVACESFRQWVIEDAFAAGRPAWDEAGAMVVADVVPYETMKLRLLNGSHSTLAYLGYLVGHETIASAIGDEALRPLIEGMMKYEISPTLSVPASVDLAQYRQLLLERFADPGLAHRTWQIAMDGSQKLPPRLLKPIAESLAAGRPFPRLALAVAGWMRYVTGIDESGQAIDVVDPLAAKLSAIAREIGPNGQKIMQRYCEIDEIFGEVGQSSVFRDTVGRWLDELFAKGVKGTLTNALASGTLPN